MSLELLGATGDGLSTKYITLRVKHIDVDKLKQAIGGSTGAAIPMTLPLIDQAPEMALRAALPFVVKKAADGYGIDLEWQVTDAPPIKGQKPQSKIGIGIATGLGISGAGFAAWKYGISRFF